MIDLFHTIIARLEPGTHHIIQFISARPDEGSPVIIRELARVISAKIGKSVLLLDINTPPSQLTAFKLTNKCDLQQAMTKQDQLDNAIARVANSSLHVCRLTNGNDSTTIVNTPEFRNTLTKLSDRFDLILIDSPPAANTATGLTIAPYINGTVIVVKAASTRWQVVDSLQKRILKYGGKIPGVILNERHDYIPAAIYKRL